MPCLECVNVSAFADARAGLSGDGTRYHPVCVFPNDVRVVQEVAMSASTGNSAGGLWGALRRLPFLVRFLLANAAIGTAVALIVVVGLLATDAASLARLILADENPAVAIGLLTFGFVITFGSAAMGAAVMGLPYERPGRPRGRRAVVDASRLVPAPAVIRPRTGAGRR